MAYISVNKNVSPFSRLETGQLTVFIWIDSQTFFWTAGIGLELASRGRNPQQSNY